MRQIADSGMMTLERLEKKVWREGYRGREGYHSQSWQT